MESQEHAGPPLLNVRETAQRLNVHENTVRNWAKDGTLKSAAVPGSRFLRFDARDIERLAQDRGKAVSAVSSSMRRFGADLVTATDLNAWSSRSAQERFPELMRRLLANTPGVSNISIRANDGIYAPGWDGIATSDGSSFLPNGVLRFEFGTDSSATLKAEHDYVNRRDSEDPSSAEHLNFIFATSKRWPHAGAWAREKQQEHVFASVRVIDADDLEGWLAETPVVHVWLSELFKRRPTEAQTIDRWWAEFSSQTNPNLPEGLFRAGREAASATLADFVASGDVSEPLTVRAPWRQDALAFVSAEMLRNNCSATVIHSADAWTRIVTESAPTVLMPTFVGANLALAQRHAHKVILVAGGDQELQPTSNLIDLPKPSPEAATKAFSDSGVDRHTTNQLVGLARRSMPALVRKLAIDPRSLKPAWATDPQAAALFAPLVLAGQWDPRDDDHAVIERLVGVDWSDIERALRFWATREDPCFVMSGHGWKVVSPVEAAMLLFPSLTNAEMARWNEALRPVILSADPTAGMDSTQRLVAQFAGTRREFSESLRTGLSAGLALVGSLGNDDIAGRAAADWGAQAAQSLIDAANAHEDESLWELLAPYLPDIAEAAPDLFLNAIEQDLALMDSKTVRMFKPSNSNDLFAPQSRHSHLLWALESLTGAREYFTVATDILATLVRLAPKFERQGNRADESLSTAFLPWIRYTNASVDERLRRLASINKRLPDVGWDLNLSLLPQSHSVSFPPHAPRYRDWVPSDQTVTIAEWSDYIRGIVQLSVNQAEEDLDRWAELIPAYSELPAEERAMIISALSAVLLSGHFGKESAGRLWSVVYKEVSRHKEFQTAAWAMSADACAPLENLLQLFRKPSPVQSFSHLFGWQARVQENQAEQQRERVEAIATMIVDGSFESIRELVDTAQAPGEVGWTIAEMIDFPFQSELLGWLESQNQAQLQAAAAYGRRKILLAGIEWLDDTLDSIPVEFDEVRVRLALQMPAVPEFWDRLRAIDLRLSDEYWTRVSSWGIGGDGLDQAVETFLKHDRPWAALNVIANSVRSEQGSTLSPEEIADIIDRFLASDGRDVERDMVSYQVGHLLDHLDQQGLDRERLARFEFAFYPLLERSDRYPSAFYGFLRTLPDYFVDLVKMVYRAKNDEDRTADEKEATAARVAWSVLHEWREVPGARANGEVDAAALGEWVHRARLLLAEADRAEIGDEQIGQLLSAGIDDGAEDWPTTAVREVIENLGSVALEAGLYTGIVNSRGITSRGPFDGGQQERDLANRFTTLARQNEDWPRVAKVLRQVADTYLRRAREEDMRAQRLADEG